MSEETNNPVPSGLRAERFQRLLDWGRHKEALAEAGEWLGEEPEAAAPYNALTLAYIKLNELDKALDCTGQALRIDPNDEDAWFLRAVIFYSTGKWPQMEEAARTALTINPYRAHLHYLLANRHNKHGKFELAKSSIEQALNIDTENGLYYSLYSYILANLLQFEASVENAEIALRKDVENSQTFLYLGWAADRRGDAKTAKTMMEQAIRIDPDDEQIRNEYMEALQKNYWFYRIFTLPVFFRRFKLWQLLLIWVVASLLFRPLVILLVILYMLSFMLSKAFVHIQVYGWRRAPKRREK
ncbi:tetratricopeptide repeat protein [Saccharibacillus sacchari]|uniref:tetratricopeptide repeat protein n=1 Tax=Saccharibacillus sacchari TaxID=456493 RepID=UPI0004B2276C|nr:tetratricopeptide repeat protein [Saccharibacillus sacchari]